MDSASPTSSAAAVRFAARVAAGEAAERLAAEAWSAGAVGIEERGEGAVVDLVIYAPAALVDAVHRAVAGAGVALSVTAVEALPDTDWSQEWRRGLTEIEVSPRLSIRPSFVSVPARPGQQVLVVDPGQAFGTGSHESTRLVIEWIDSLRSGFPEGGRVLDVGTGTGLLALASVALLGARCLGFDLDPRATEAARENAAANGMTACFDLFTGPLDAVAGEPFELVLANLLKNEMLPLLPAIAAHTAPGGAVVLSGLLAREVDPVTRAASAAGLRPVDAREARDANGDVWTALLMRR